MNVKNVSRVFYEVEKSFRQRHPHHPVHLDAANPFKPLLARGKLHCIGATTLSEYTKYIEIDAALERRFVHVLINEASVPETISILRGIREKYEVYMASEYLIMR